ncbi:hypothetical protein ES332_A07G118000v1 [Gossypium tomentosum]|uniref:Uncharacterized protein n=1 Tax=Gossypium tomentosum TaxID=34277 RepID=A0A5D2PRU9_GOSTO|nr:hypothetical protein ES332_A07G118000v1 [Gossypium tomentosum]
MGGGAEATCAIDVTGAVGVRGGGGKWFKVSDFETLNLGLVGFGPLLGVRGFLGPKLSLYRGNIERIIKRLMVDMEGNYIKKRALDLKEKVAFCLMEDGSTSCSFNGLAKHISSI